MKNSKIISAILVIVLTMSVFTIPSYADESVEDIAKAIDKVLLELDAISNGTKVKVNNTGFSDLVDSSYCADAAKELSEKGILDGYDDGTFGADKSITRAEMAAVICRMINKESEANKKIGRTDYKDVDSSHWASGYVNVASANSIINGDKSMFRPGDNVKNEEAIKMVICAIGLGQDVIVNSNDWSAGYISKAKSYGITNNMKSSKGDYLTRGDVAVLVSNALNVKTPTSNKEQTATTKPMVTSTPKPTATPEKTFDLSYNDAYEYVERYIESMLKNESNDIVIEGNENVIKYQGEEAYKFYCFSKSLESDGQNKPLLTVYVFEDGSMCEE